MNERGSGIFDDISFQAYLKDAWNKKGFQLENDSRMGVSVSELVSHSMKRNASLNLSFVNLWVAILDECISWFISLNTVIYLDRPSQGQMDNFEKSCLTIISKIISDSTSIRYLVIAGFDTSSRAILRSAAEYMEVLVAIVHDPELANDFAKTDTPEAAQLFWERHLRGGKIRRRVTRAWADFFGAKSDQAAAEWFANWGRESSPLLSGISHPSVAGGLFSLVPMKAEYIDENWLGIWGDKSESSVFTISIYTNFVFPILLLGEDFPFNNESVPIKRKYDDENEIHRHVRHGRSILASLIMSLGMESNRSYVFPEIDMSIWPGDPLAS